MGNHGRTAHLFRSCWVLSAVYIHRSRTGTLTWNERLRVELLSHYGTRAYHSESQIKSPTTGHYQVTKPCEVECKVFRCQKKFVRSKDHVICTQIIRGLQDSLTDKGAISRGSMFDEPLRIRQASVIIKPFQS